MSLSPVNQRMMHGMQLIIMVSLTTTTTTITLPFSIPFITKRTLSSSLTFIWEEDRGRCMSNMMFANTTITTTLEPTVMEGLQEKNQDAMNLFPFIFN